MDLEVLLTFLSGAITMGFLVAGLFLLRSYMRSRDLFFLAFAAAFWLLALNQALTGLLSIPREEQTPIYLLRLAAFLLIIVAILLKNRNLARRD